MRRSAGKGRGLMAAAIAVGMGLAGLAGARPAAAQDCSTVAPYVFVLFDTSGSMNWAPPCSQAELDAGFCSWRCDSSDCWVPKQADDPASKFFQVKQALYDVLANTTGVQVGFATFNQDGLSVRGKHWRYQAGTGGVSIPGWGPFPSPGSEEVLGLTWNCDTGSGDNEIGCYAASPADLVDPWELARVRRVPKAGVSLTTAMTFFIRQSATTYKVTYTPRSGSLGGLVQMTVAVLRCNNASCSTTTSLGAPTLTFTPIDEFLSWDVGDGSVLSRSNPQLSYFLSSAASDSSAGNSCSGWDPNTDSTADLNSAGYRLRWPTDSSDSRGLSFTLGDVIPQDWRSDHRSTVQQRLSPNGIASPAAPDFRISSYLQDRPAGAETFLRLKDANQRPLIASGASPLGASINSFRKWWSGCTTGLCSTGWASVAQAQDPDWACRRQYLLVLSDGDDTCSGLDACAQVSDLSSYYGIKTYAVGLGAGGSLSAPGNKLTCIAAAGGTSAPYTPHLRQDLEDTLNAIFTSIKTGI
jgi:hypothetical protein